MRILSLAVAGAALAASFGGTAHAVVRCVPITVLQGGACVEANVPGHGTGPTLRVSCGGTFWDCATIVVP